MATDNNTFVNSFVTGMDSDSSLDRVKATSYLEARNIRVMSYDGDNSHGSMRPINGIKLAGVFNGENVERILASGSIRDIGVIVYISKKNLTPEFCIAKFNNKLGGEDTDDQFCAIGDLEVIFRSKLIDWPTDPNKWPKKVSTVFRYESEKNIKLYVATGFNPILIFNIADSYDPDLTLDAVQCYPKISFQKPKFIKYVSGALKTGYVSYSYQIYKNYSMSTDISPACQPIPIINMPNDSDVLGTKTGQQGETTDCGVKILINPDVDYSFLDRIKIYRIHIQVNGQLPTIEVIYDSSYEPNSKGEFYINDTGQSALDTITVEEYNSMAGIHIVPKLIESKDNMLFAANINEKQTFIDTERFKNWDARAFRANENGEIVLTSTSTEETATYTWDQLEQLSASKGDIERDSYNYYNEINKNHTLSGGYCVYDKDGYYGGTGINVSWRFVITYVPIDTCSTDGAGEIGTMWNVLKVENTNETPTLYFINKNGLQDAGISISDEQGRINNSWITKSLRRNELYRYGIILYDKIGNPSPVKWIADIRTPNLYEEYFNTFISHYNNKYDLASLPLGVAFNVSNLPDECTGYEIVRCQRREQDIATISQGVTSKPIVGYSAPSTNRTDRTTYFPTGLLTTARVAQGSTFEYFRQESYNPYDDDSIRNSAYECATNLKNTQLLQFVSTETSYQPESFKSLTTNKNYYLEPVRYLFGQSGKCSELTDQGVRTFPYGYKYILHPSISNANLFLAPNDSWNYYYRDDSKVVGEKITTNRFVLKMQTPDIKSIYYKVQQSDKTWGCLGVGSIDSASKTSSEKLNCLDDKAFAYIKLYEQADELMGSARDTNSVETSILELFYGKANTSVYPQIDDIQIATQLKWDEVIKRTYLEKGSNSQTENCGKWWPKIQYNKHVDSIGKYQFCNAVFYGCDGAQIDRIEGSGEGDDGWTISNDMIDFSSDADRDNISSWGTTGDDDRDQHILGIMFSTGGRCAVLSLNDTTAYNSYDIDNLQFKDYNKLLPSSTFNSTLGAVSYYVNKNNLLVSSTNLSTYQSEVGKPVNINSVAGTVLCNMRKRVTPYDGCTEKSVSSSTYRSNGQFFANKNEWNAVFDGDVYISVLDYTAMHKATCTFVRDKDTADERDPNDYRSPSMMLGYAIPLESTINCRFTYGFEFSKNSSVEGATMIQVEPANVNNTFTQTDPEYVFNTAYAAENTSRVHAAFDSTNIEDFNKEVDYMCRYSNLKENDEHIDSWTKFQSSNYLDVDSKYGEITEIRQYKQWLVFWQQIATGLLSVNERALTEDNNGTQLILGTGGVLSRYDYLDQTAGMHKEQMCDVQSTSTLYWYDHHNQELKAFDGQGVQSLGKQASVQSLLYKYQDKDQTPALFFDDKNNEIICKVLSDDNSVAYNEAIKAFPSIYTIPFDSYITFSNKTFLIRNVDGDLSIAQWDASNENTTSWNNKIISAYIKYIVNANPAITKVFDNQEIVTPQDEFAYFDLKKVDYNSYFSTDKEYKWSTDSGMKAEDTLNNKVTIREHNYRYAIPRDNRSSIYGARMRGKYLIGEIQDNKPNTNVAIQYILTKFRASWI